MITHNNFYFLNEVSVAMESPITHNTRGEVLTLQVEGTASAVKLQVLGCSDMASDEFHVLSGLNTAYNHLDTITEKGIYTYGIEGMGKIKVVLLEVSGGEISAFGKVTMGV